MTEDKSYTRYIEQELALLKEDIRMKNIASTVIIQRCEKIVRAMGNYVLESENLLSVFNQFTVHSYDYITTIDLSKYFYPLESIISKYEESEDSAVKRYELLEALFTVIKGSVKPNTKTTQEALRSMVSIDEEVSTRSSRETAILFIKLAKGLYNHYGLVERQGMGALYMASKYTIFSYMEENNYNISPEDLDNGKSALYLVEKYKISEIDKMIPSLIDIQARVQDKNVTQPASFSMWIAEVEQTLNKQVKITGINTVTSEFGG